MDSYSYFDFIIIIFWFICSTRSSRPDVVTRPIDLDRLYTNMKEHSVETSGESIRYEYAWDDWRIALCERILNSRYFQIKQEIYENTWRMHIAAEVNKWYILWVDNLYQVRTHIEETRIEKRWPWPLSFLKWRKTVFNAETLETPPPRYFTRKVFHNGVYHDEKLFTCLARQIRTGELKQYFITLRYRQIRNEDSSFVYFVFSYNIQRQLVLQASVEQQSLISSEIAKLIIYFWEETERIVDINEYYMEGREQKNKSDSTYSSDPLCGQLSNSGKLRVCTSVMNSLPNTILFWTTIFNLNYKCIRGDVSLEGNFQKNRSYKEWLLGCNARIRKSNERITYYVSTNKEHDTSLIGYYKNMDGKFTPNYLFKNVSPMCLNV